MNLLFVHQNMPGQYRELIRFLANRPEHNVVFLTQRRDIQLDGITLRTYQPKPCTPETTFALARHWEESAATGFAAAQAAKSIEVDDGFLPDVVIGHTGWGELTFFKEIWPNVPILGFFEFFYSKTDGISGFDPEEAQSEQAGYFLHARNALALANFETVDQGHCPTFWQRDGFPERFHDAIYVKHDGIRTDLLRPNPDAQIKLSRLDAPLTRRDEVVTYVARNLERARGFHVMMRALPEILQARPDARIVIVGGNESSYSKRDPSGQSLRQQMQRELGAQVDWDRVHFLGRIPYNLLCNLLQISRCHIYMSMPFVVSWSLLEAMSMQATVLCSDVAPNREMVTHGKTGLLVDYFDTGAISRQVIDVLSYPEDYAHLGPAARQHVVENHDFLDQCLPEHIRRINALAPGSKQITLDPPATDLRMAG